MTGRGADGPRGWGPERHRAAVAITFDNLGEATDLERGVWPQDEPVGRHHSVTHALPRLLGLLAELELTATFFVEGLNAQLYPRALREIAGAGHEVAYHGWRHEPWSQLHPAQERELLERGVQALDTLGLRPVGFRPPGGALLPSSARTLAELGFTYVSPAGYGAGVRDGLAVLPFRWPLLDAFHYLPHFAGRRKAALGAGDVLPPGVLRQTLASALDEVVEQRGMLCLLFHPFLADADDRFRALSAVLRQLGERVGEGAAWSAPLRDMAAWVRVQPGAASWKLELEG